MSRGLQTMRTVRGPCAAQSKTLVQQLEHTSSLASAVSLARSSRSNWGMKTVVKASLRALSRMSFQALAVVLTLWLQYSSLICCSRASSPFCSGMSGRTICRSCPNLCSQYSGYVLSATQSQLRLGNKRYCSVLACQAAHSAHHAQAL